MVHTSIEHNTAPAAEHLQSVLGVPAAQAEALSMPYTVLDAAPGNVSVAAIRANRGVLNPAVNAINDYLGLFAEAIHTNVDGANSVDMRREALTESRLTNGILAAKMITGKLVALTIEPITPQDTAITLARSPRRSWFTVFSPNLPRSGTYGSIEWETPYDMHFAVTGKSIAGSLKKTIGGALVLTSAIVSPPPNAGINEEPRRHFAFAIRPMNKEARAQIIWHTAPTDEQRVRSGLDQLRSTQQQLNP